MRHRTATTPFDVIASGETPGDDPDRARETIEPYRAAGATWWIEGVSPWRWGASWDAPWTPRDTELIRERVRQGPPLP